MQFFIITNYAAIFIFVHKSLCASVIVPFGCVPGSEIPWWQDLNNFNKVFPSCPSERAIYSLRSRIGNGLVLIIYKKAFWGSFKADRLGPGSLSLNFTQDSELGIRWSSTNVTPRGKFCKE